MKQLQGISIQEREDFEAWKSYMTMRKKFERKFEHAAEDMFDKMRKVVKAKIKEMSLEV